VKNKKQIGLDVDFIGGDKPLTDKEEKMLSDYFKNLKDKNINAKGILTKKKVVGSKKQLVHS
jgi:hypothetical protein